MTVAGSKRLRLASCIDAILEIHSILLEDGEEPEWLARFKELEHALNDLEVDFLTEEEVGQVEEATNRLLGELKNSFCFVETDALRPGPFH